jgi:hypothetical protein
VPDRQPGDAVRGGPEGPPRPQFLAERARLPDYCGRDHFRPEKSRVSGWICTRWSSLPPSGQPPPGSQNVDYPCVLDHLLSLVAPDYILSARPWCIPPEAPGAPMSSRAKGPRSAGRRAGEAPVEVPSEAHTFGLRAGSDADALGEELPVVGGVSQDQLGRLRPLEVQVGIVLPGEADASVDLDVLCGCVEVRL